MKSAPKLSMALTVALLLASCSSSSGINQNPSSNLPVQTQPAQAREVKFRIDPAFGFRTQQTATANYVRLTISNGTQTIYANGADANGFLQVQGSGAINLGATVPDGKFWTATIGFYTQAPVSSGTQPAPFLELKTAFDVPTTGQVAIDYGTYLKGAIVEELRKLNSPLLTGGTAVELNALQAYVDALTGKTVNGQSLSFTRLAAQNPPLLPQSLDARMLAVTLNGMAASAITTTFGGAQVLSELLPLPQFMGVYPKSPQPSIGGELGRGVDQGIAINRGLGSGDDKIFFADTADVDSAGANSSNIEYLHGLTFNWSTSAFTTLFSKIQFNQIKSAQLVLGRSNDTAASAFSSLFFLNQNGTTSTLQVRNQLNGNLVWRHDFSSVDAASTPFAPVLKRLVNGSCACDDEHMAIVAIKHTDAGTPTKIYGMRQERASYTGILPAGTTNGHIAWEYTAANNTENVLPGGALSADGTKFYALVSQIGTSATPRLVILNADTGAQIAAPNLPASSSAVGSPVLGHNGNVYVVVRQAGGSSLYAFNGSTGAALWNRTLITGSATRVWISPVVDYDGTSDVIYAVESKLGDTTFAPVMHAIKDNNSSSTLKWATPFAFTGAKGMISAAGLLIGAEPDGTRVIYAGFNDGKVYAVRDKGTTGSLDWSTFPNGTLWASNSLFFSGTATWQGFSLRDSRLFVTTRDGGEGNSTLLQAIKVSTPNLPVNAPWPKTGGNLRNSGVTQLETNQE